MFFAVYDPSTGEILRTGFAPEPETQGEHVLVTDALVADDESYVSGGVVVPRPVLPGFDRYTMIADGVDFVGLYGLPAGAQVEVVDVGTWAVADGAFEFSATVADTYTVRVTAWPYLPAEHEIVAETP